MTSTPTPSHLDLGVMGMTCTSCSSRVQRKLNKVAGVDATAVSYTHLTLPTNREV